MIRWFIPATIMLAEAPLYVMQWDSETKELAGLYLGGKQADPLELKPTTVAMAVQDGIWLELKEKPDGY